MKRIPCLAVIAALVLVVTACGTAPYSQTPPPQPTQHTVTVPFTTQPPATTAPPPTETTAPPETVYIPEIYPDAVGLYIPADDGTRGRKLITEFTAKRTPKKDIDCFEVFASMESYITGSSFSSMWKTAWNVYEDVQDAKIGFYIQFELADGNTVGKTILKPGDAKEFYDYLEVYLYDDIHQIPGVRYSHLEDSQMDANTIISSIKLTSGDKIDQVGDIILTAFIYNGDNCFDADGRYIGLVSASAIIRDE